MKTDWLTPWELRDGTWYKREDLYSHPGFGVNGAKYRACHHLISRAKAAGATRVVSAASVLSPQSAMAAVLAAELDMDCTVIVGGTTPDKAVRHRSIAIASAAGADIEAIKVGYNPALQAAGRRKAEETPGAWQLPYGITTPADASREDVEAFLAVGGAQVAGLPEDIETLVLPFGSGNTAAGVLYGLTKHPCPGLKQVILMGIGPDRQAWLQQRLGNLEFDFDLEHIALHPWFATYGDSMRFTRDGIKMHPTYEGKVCSWLDQAKPGWDSHDGTMGLWIVGGPI